MNRNDPPPDRSVKCSADNNRQTARRIDFYQCRQLRQSYIFSETQVLLPHLHSNMCAAYARDICHNAPGDKGSLGLMAALTDA
jgi:hypothetical protein